MISHGSWLDLPPRNQDTGFKIRRPVHGQTTPMADPGISSFNCIVHERLLDWIVRAAPLSAPFEEKAYEWGDAVYLLQRSPDNGSITLSLALPSHQHGDAAWAAAYKGIATLAATPQPGYHATLELNMRMLAKLEPKQQEYWLKELASLRLHIMSTPLRLVKQTH